MLVKKVLKILIKIYILLVLSLISSSSFASNPEFNAWVKNFKNKAVNSGISKKVVDDVMSDVTFLPKVIEYDRFQPEYYEDTRTYIKKRKNKKKEKKGKVL